MKKRLSILGIAALTVLGLAGCNEKGDHEGHSDHAGHTAGQTVCPVSGEALGSMGEPIVVTHEGKEVKLCCKSCLKDFNADPATYTAKIHGS